MQRFAFFTAGRRRRAEGEQVAEEIVLASGDAYECWGKKEE